MLPFPSGTLTAELVLLLFLTLLEFTRIFTGWKANLTENIGGMGICIALFVPGILGVLYFLIWQVINKFCHKMKYKAHLHFQAYILRLELVLCSVQLTVQGLQLIFSLICMISFYGGTF